MPCFPALPASREGAEKQVEKPHAELPCENDEAEFDNDERLG